MGWLPARELSDPVVCDDIMSKFKICKLAKQQIVNNAMQRPTLCPRVHSL